MKRNLWITQKGKTGKAGGGKHLAVRRTGKYYLRKNAPGQKEPTHPNEGKAWISRRGSTEKELNKKKGKRKAKRGLGRARMV